MTKPIVPVGEPSTVVLTTKVDDLLNWGRASSLWYMLFGLACCAIEMMQTGGPRADLDRFGAVPRATPRQSDLMLVAGTVTYKMAIRTKLLYEQMPEPKFVISMGSCATCGGLFQLGYSVLKGVDKVIPVDVYLPGCPPRPEALTQALLYVQQKIRSTRPFKLNHEETKIFESGAPGSGGEPGRGQEEMESKAIAQIIKDAFPQVEMELVEEKTAPPYLVVPPEHLLEVARKLRDDPELSCESLSCLSAVDEGDHLTTVYHLFSYAHRHMFVIKVRVPRDNPRVHSVDSIWPGANWFEREAYDLMGIVYEGSRDLRRIMMPEDWVGHPLRKDYHEPEEYRGMGTGRNDPMDPIYS